MPEEVSTASGKFVAESSVEIEAREESVFQEVFYKINNERKINKR